MRPRIYGNEAIHYRTPILASPEAGDALYLYLVVSNASVSAALLNEDENRKQGPIFFIRKSLFEEKTQYTHLEKVALTLRMASMKLHPYF